MGPGTISVDPLSQAQPQMSLLNNVLSAMSRSAFRMLSMLRKNRWIMPLMFPALAALEYLSPYHPDDQAFVEHMLEWHVLAVFALSILFGYFIYYSDSKTLEHTKKLYLYKEILEKIPTDIAVFDAEHRYVYVNPAAISKTDLRNWIIGKTDFEYFSYRGYDQTVAQSRHIRFHSAMESGRTVSWVDSLNSESQGVRHVQRSFKPVFTPNGKLDYMFGFGADVTELVTLKNRDADLHANMRYAVKLQSMLLPSLHQMERNLAPTMVIWKPKDVVSGDFYWHRRIDGKNYLAVADCTGHGVAGALLTVVCIDTLNRCIDEFGQRSPAAILNLCQELLTVSLRSSINDMEDGMDICLCCIEDGTLHWASANRPLYLQSHGELIIHKPDRISIGRKKQGHRFIDNQIVLQPNDRLMLYSDGVTDQFGGEHDRKFGKVRLHDMLTKMNGMPLKEMYDTIYKGCEVWKGHREQVDDKTFLVVEFTENCAALRNRKQPTASVASS